MGKFESASEPSGEWPTVLEQLIVGVSHHISNRVSTLAGVSDILAGDPTIPPVLRALADEVPKLEEAIRVLRLLAAPDDPEEAVEPKRVVEDAVTLARLHPELKHVTFSVQGSERVPPIVVRPVAFTHQIVMLLVAAVRDARDDVIVDLVSDGEYVSIGSGGRTLCAPTLMTARR